MKYSSIEEVFAQVQKPSRYIGGEINSIKKNWAKCKLTFALAFPDAYEVGMSHLGIQILYSILNNQPAIAAERVFAPWPDMELWMRKKNISLFSLESRTALNQFDIVGFSLQYELSYTNVLNMLDLGGIAIYARDRGEDSPIIIAGGPCAFNPEPVLPFFDAFVIGEGEEVILEISRAIMEGKGKKYKKQDIFVLLASIDGVYVPSIHVNGERIKKRVVMDINKLSLPHKPVIPLMKIIHDRISLEIARGCSRGCRFCQAGMVWRPIRERTPEKLMKMAGEMLSSTGYDEISLLSLSSGDYSLIEYFLTLLMNEYYEQRIAIALPSMRVETLTEKLIDQIKRVRKTSFTLAPEAGTQRLRNLINKGNTEENLLNTTRHVFDAGWKSLKLYFMLGLPTETKEDLEGITDLAYRTLREGGKKRQVTISLSTFVPKPHTPFQWQRQIGLDEIQEKQDFFKKNIRHRNLNLKWHDGRMSLLEGVLSRGSKNVGNLIAKAFTLGCRFDGWSDQFRFDLWEQAMQASNINIADYLKEKSLSENLPWDRIDCGISKDFLIKEYEKAIREELTEDCRFGTCHNCGVCDKDLKVILATDHTSIKPAENREKSRIDDRYAKEKKFRIKFAKHGDSRLLSHLETSSAIVRSIRRNGLTFVFSVGFHPHPKISFAFASPVGIESCCEYADIQIKSPPQDMERLVQNINSSLPSGLEILDIEEIPLEADSLSNIISGYHYEIYLPEKLIGSDRLDFEKKIKNFLDLETFTVMRNKKGKTIEKNIRPFVSTLSFDRTDYRIDISSRFGSDGGVSPWEILKNVIGLPDEMAKRAKIMKTAPIFTDRKL